MKLNYDYLDKNLWRKIRDPITLVGNELNIPKKNFDNTEVRTLFAFPDLYRMGMSNQGLKILYEIINSRSEFSAERVFSVTPDIEKTMRDGDVPLYSLETKSTFDEFDLIAFSIPHELSYTSILQILELGDIKLLSKEREELPLVIGGGPAVVNPEPIAPFFDLIFIGDGEEGIIDILDVVSVAKKQTWDRLQLLENLKNIEGVYIPDFFTPVYVDNKLKDYSYKYKDYTKVKKRIFKDINEVSYPVDQLVPLTTAVHDRFTVEVARGCVRSCRFCQAGMTYRPVRERDINQILDVVKKGVNSTGIGDISFLSLSVGDYTKINELVAETMNWAEKENVSLSFPSIRVDTLQEEVIEQIKKVRKTGFTIAPETGSDRLRAFINKEWTNDEIVEAAKKVYDAGWSNIKLYFMIGLPSETEGDIDAIVDLVKKVRQIKNKKVSASVAMFVPKPQTPFQWDNFKGIEYGNDVLDKLKYKIRKVGGNVKWHTPELSYFETILSSGDRRVASIILNVYQNGGRLDNWNDYFNLDLWKTAVENSNLPYYDWIGKKNFDDFLPWDIIDYRIPKKFFVSERNKAEKFVKTDSCLTSSCTGCGVCDFKEINNLPTEELIKTKDVFKNDNKKSGNVRYKYLVYYGKKNELKYISTKDLNRLWGIFLRRAGLNVYFSEGFHPLTKLTFINPASVGVESEEEIVEIYLNEKYSVEYLVKVFSDTLPENLLPVKVVPVEGKININTILEGFKYEITILGDYDLKNAIIRYNDLEEIILERRIKKRIQRKNIKKYVKIDCFNENKLNVTILVDNKGTVPVIDFISLFFNIEREIAQQFEIKRGKILLRDFYEKDKKNIN